MKKIIRIIALILLLMLTSSAPVYANSAPVYWQGYPAAEMMSIDPDTPIIVESEELIFDFSQQRGFSYALEGKVTATYQMFNPTPEMQIVQMAFPFVGTLAQLNTDEIVIAAEKEKLSYEIYLGEQFRQARYSSAGEERMPFTFSGIVETLTTQTYQAQNFAENEQGKLYLFTITPTAEQEIIFALDFTFDPQQTKILTKGFNRYERDGNKIRIAARCHLQTQLEVLVLGKDLEFKSAAYADGELSKETNLYKEQKLVQTVKLKQYLLSLAQDKISVQDKELFATSQLYNLFAKFLDQYFTQNPGYCSVDDLDAASNSNFIVALVYLVEFMPQERKEVSIGFQTVGTMDKRETTIPQYSYFYLLNPASHWKDFKNLSIKVLTPEEAPFVVNSSLTLKQTGERVYTAKLPHLPNGDFSFTLYAKEKITVADKVAGKVNHIFGYFTPLLPGILAIAMIIVVLVLRKRKHK
ncbi:MAG: hypothetical protein GX893_05725 [Firmicutes bacterium]|nr:hypothetical protein [Bacillota bacterium]